MKNYKEINFKLGNYSSKKIRDFLGKILYKENKENIFFEINNKEIKIFLRLLNFERFKEEVNKLSKEESLNKNHPILRLLQKIKSIKAYSIKSGKRFYVDYNKERKVKDRQDKVKKRKAENKDNKFLMEKNNIPIKYKNKIICGDSLKVLKKLPDNCIDLVFTSPPYNFGLEYDSQDDAVVWEEYFEFLFKIFRECIRVLKFGGRIIINVQPLFSDYIPSHHIISNFFLKEGLLWKGEIIWEKNNYNCKYTAWGSWKSPSSPYFKYTWEFLEIFCKGSRKKEGEKKNIDISAEEFKKWVVAKWSIAPERNMKKLKHPAMFPEKLAYRVIKLFSYKKDIILDPFNGVGTTTLLAKQMKREYLGIDISKKYCRTAEKRLKDLN